MAVKNNICKKDIFYLMNKYSGAISIVERDMFLEYLFSCAKLDLYVKDFVISDAIEGLYDSLIERRIRGEPAQYITSRAEFMGMDFLVTKDTLIPRPETEILVNEIYASMGRLETSPFILDLCAGSGNIAVSLAKLIPEAEVIATDISEDALKVAEKNAIRHRVDNRIKFYRGDLFNAFCFTKNPKFDIIACNPPYIKRAELAYLQKEVRREPGIALDGGEDGLDFYRVIASQSHRYLKKRGSILLEIGFGQKEAVKDIFTSCNIYEVKKIIRDFSSIERAIWINLL